MLKEISAKKNTSIAEVVRECIAYYSTSKCMISNKEKYRKAINSIGRFKSGKKDISINHDKYLAEDFKK
ncbi:unnamed protein product [marine sediment metagenome]|uniref:Ribbon-helix-helix protein CopG domain-containing protein n=1 Tax=marine sediment metagenome TaxID=412755 RepID=X1D6W5_9ZZZZ